MNTESCPKCCGEITFGYGLAGGGVDKGNGTEPGGYWMCLDCDWMGPKAQNTICFPHGLVEEKTA